MMAASIEVRSAERVGGELIIAPQVPNGLDASHPARSSGHFFRKPKMSAADNPKLAVLIDADNASASLVKELLEEVAKFGTATVKRAYGDWTGPHLTGWKDQLNRYAIQPIQQFAYTRGKNSTDASL